MLKLAKTLSLQLKLVLQAQRRLEKIARFGGQVGIIGHITIGNNVRIQAQSGIGKSIADNEIVQGSPAIALYRL